MSGAPKAPSGLACPVPIATHETIQMAHGGGGRRMRELIERVFVPAFGHAQNGPLHDSAVFAVDGTRLAFTTDTFVVSPIFFPGGDIGRLAVFGTVNDLAMAGAHPRALSAAFVLEEGFAQRDLARIVTSMRDAANEAGVAIVTGDTKVVDRGKGDGIYINTAGVGVVAPGVEISPARVRTGDAVIVSGDLGRHGVAILSVREGIAFETKLESDCAPLVHLVDALIGASVEVHCLRDLTRGGLASALNEIALDGRIGIEIDEARVTVCAPVRAACELLGLDPFYVANEGRFVAFVPEADSARALDALRRHPLGKDAAIVGRVVADHVGQVHLSVPFGTTRILDLLSGEQMPRIC